MSTYEDLTARRTAARNILTGKITPDPARGQHNIPTVAVALDALQSLVEFHGGHTDAAALQVIRDALTPRPHREPRSIPAVQGG